MTANFEITADPRLDLIRMTLSGFFTPQDVARFDDERLAAYRLLDCGPNKHLTLCDVSEMKIQAQDVVAAFAQIVANPRHAARRLAVVTGSSLARLQMRRVTSRPDVAFFDDVKAAEAWLLA